MTGELLNWNHRRHLSLKRKLESSKYKFENVGERPVFRFVYSLRSLWQPYSLRSSERNFADDCSEDEHLREPASNFVLGFENDLQLWTAGMKFKKAEWASMWNAINRSQAVIEFKVDGTILTANDNFLSALGYTLDEIEGKHHRVFCSLEHSSSAEYRNFWNRIGDGEFVQGEFERFTKEGESIWIQGSYNPIFDRLGRISKVVKFAVDITEQIRQREEFELLSLVANKTDNSVIITDGDGLIEYVNPGFVTLTGYTAKEVIGRKPGSILQGKHTDPATVARIRDNVATQTPFYEEILNYSKSGKPYWISLAINPVFDGNGKLVRFISIQANINDTKLGSLEFNEKLKAISASGAMCEWDADGNLESANIFLEELTGGDLVGVDAFKLDRLIGEDKLNSLNTGNVLKQQLLWPVNSSENLSLDAAISSICDLDGRVTKYIMFAIDVTSRQRTIVRETERAMSETIDSAAKVSQAVSTINAISEQTKLLALNATIEAARAGEAGKGFAVVASEVKDLSARSTNAAREIDEVIRRSEESVRGLADMLMDLAK